MPNRVDANANGLRPTQAVRPEAPPNNRVEQQANRPEPNQQTDRVEISDLARERAEAARPRAGGAEDNRAGVGEQPGARQPVAGQQGALDQPAVQGADQNRPDREAANREAPQRPEAGQGNLVDVVG